MALASLRCNLEGDLEGSRIVERELGYEEDLWPVLEREYIHSTEHDLSSQKKPNKQQNALSLLTFITSLQKIHIDENCYSSA